MKKHQLFCCVALGAMLAGMPAHAQNTGINEDGSLPDPHAILDVKSFNKDFLLPRVGLAARGALPKVKGLLLYDSRQNVPMYNDGYLWRPLGVGDTVDAWHLSALYADARAAIPRQCASRYGVRSGCGVKAVQEQQRTIQQQEKRLADLQEQIDQLKKRAIQ